MILESVLECAFRLMDGRALSRCFCSIRVKYWKLYIKRGSNNKYVSQKNCIFAAVAQDITIGTLDLHTYTKSALSADIQPIAQYFIYTTTTFCLHKTTQNRPKMKIRVTKAPAFVPYKPHERLLRSHRKARLKKGFGRTKVWNSLENLLGSRNETSSHVAPEEEFAYFGLILIQSVFVIVPDDICLYLCR